MKKIVTLLLICCLAIVPFVFSGCGSEYSAAQISSLYNSIKNGTRTAEFFTSKNLLVTYESGIINNARYNSDSPIYLLFYIYEPMLINGSQMFITKAEASTFKSVLSKFSPESRNTIYQKLKELNKNLKNLESIKSTFDSANSADGNFLETLLYDYNKTLKTVITLNTVFAKEYYRTIISKRDYTGSLVNADIDDVLMYNKLLFTDVMHKYYVRYFTLANPPKPGVQHWLNEWTHINTYLSLLEYRKSSPTGVNNNNRENIRTLLTNLQYNYNTYMTSKKLFERSLNDFPYKDFYYRVIERGMNRANYISSSTAIQQSSFYVAENFMNTYNTARMGGILQLITYYTTQ